MQPLQKVGYPPQLQNKHAFFISVWHNPYKRPPSPPNFPTTITTSSTSSSGSRTSNTIDGSSSNEDAHGDSSTTPGGIPLAPCSRVSPAARRLLSVSPLASITSPATPPPLPPPAATSSPASCSRSRSASARSSMAEPLPSEFP
ncbi:hypothetical protein KSP40_PGU019577 [Platanthera guangdongensis]|uniref:Uncharacterized protein n=1 Tax=Platanthera guangdongensis TaxID=2320717 RepID=A0ABR2MJ23_9ASPA